MRDSILPTTCTSGQCPACTAACRHVEKPPSAPVLTPPSHAAGVPGWSTGLAEYGVALSQGYVLEAPLGSGHFGRVYRARSKATGQVRGGQAGALPNRDASSWGCLSLQASKLIASAASPT